ncbi:MAG: nitrile hydratase accessory protein [Acidimicrobiales bacterium]
MSNENDTADPLDVDGPAAPPRANGELVFTSPWQSRLFATTMRLRERELLDWETFRQGLIAQIAAHEREIDHPDDYDYWGCWQRALELLLDETGVVPTATVDSTAEAVAARPPDHAAPR